MKKIIFIGLFLAVFAAQAIAQTNTFPTSGSAGIGTLSPQGLLDIYNTNDANISPLLSIRSNFHVAGYYGMIRFGDYTQTSNYQKGALIYEGVAGSARGKFHIALENTDSSNSVSLTDAKLTVLSDGNVGIGTTTPTEKLSVNGKIRAKEIKVETANWPDYVFEEDYQSLSLAELEKFIKANKHLPEMPTAKEVTENGIALGEMNKLLLKKVEEITLLLIEKEKELKIETDKNKTQDERLAKLETYLKATNK